MRARPREPQEGVSTSFKPTEHMLDMMHAGVCMADGCHRALEVRITTQLTWRSPSAVWGFCGAHGAARMPLFVGAHCYWLGIEQWGVEQDELPFG